MSAQVTEAHLRLANQLVSSPPSPLVLATLIADSEAKAVAEWQDFVHLKGEAIDSLLLECGRLRAELATEREKVRVLRDACESICEEWGKNHDANPIGAGQRMETLASKALEKLEDEA